jgi:hypothetical protein
MQTIVKTQNIDNGLLFKNGLSVRVAFKYSNLSCLNLEFWLMRFENVVSLLFSSFFYYTFFIDYRPLHKYFINHYQSNSKNKIKNMNVSYYLIERMVNRCFKGETINEFF